MDSDQGKLFVGGIPWGTTEEKLEGYFGQYGDVLQTVVMRDKISGKPRGFGFVVFSDPNLLETVLQDTHVIDGRTVEVKRALSREEQQISKAGNPSSSRNFGGGGGTARTKKIFVGGLPATLTDDDFRQYFETYGNVTDVVIMFDQQTNRPRGFGFISFDSEDAVERILHKTFHDLNGKQVEVKRAFPKDANPGGSGRSMGGGAGGGSAGSYQVYGASSGNSNSYESRMDSNRYMHSQNTGGGGYPPYGSSGYNAASYGYGPTSNGMGYGGYGSYGGANPGYGGPAAAAYGNPNVTSAGYGSVPPGALRNTWNSQGSGYGHTGYANATWGAPNASGSSPGSGAAVTGHSPSGAAGYGNQGYGYEGYGPSDGAYGNPTAGGRAGSIPTSNAAVGGNGADIQAGGGGYIGGGYGDAAGNSGYGNPGWRSDSSQASNYGTQSYGPHGDQIGYGGAYGGAPTRQAQQQ